MKIAFVHFPGRLARLEAARAGEGPSEFLFGAVELERRGHEIAHYEVDPDARVGPVAARVIDRSAGRGLLPPHLATATLRGTRALRRELRRADIVVGSTTGTAMALATWRAAGLVRRPLVGIVAGLVNNPWRRARKLTALRLLLRMHAVLYGVGELQPLLERAPRLAGRVHVNAFGVDTEFWTPGEGVRSDYVLAIGNDGHRDWETLLDAARDIPTAVRVYTRRPAPPALPPNVTWHDADWHRRVLSDEEVRELFRRAAVVAVPVKDVPQPSGQSVTLQAMACGRPVVLTRTRGLWDPTSLHDGGDVSFVPPNDAGALAAAVTDLLGDGPRAMAMGAAARSSVLRCATVDAYADRLEQICRAAVDDP